MFQIALIPHDGHSETLTAPQLVPSLSSEAGLWDRSLSLSRPCCCGLTCGEWAAVWWWGAENPKAADSAMVLSQGLVLSEWKQGQANQAAKATFKLMRAKAKQNKMASE